jgi:hypothetical protein
VELLGRTGTTKTDIDRLCTRLRSKAKDVRVVDESPYIRAVEAVEAVASVDDPKHARTEKQARVDD